MLLTGLIVVSWCSGGSVSAWSAWQDIITQDYQVYCLPGVAVEQTGPPRCRGVVRGIATPALLCHKEPARASKAPY